MVATELSLGGMLQEAREIKKVSLEEVSKATKISIDVLKALEADELQRLPGEIYARVFIKAYADFLEIGPQVMQQFKKIARPSSTAIPIIKPKSSVERMGRGRGKALPRRALLALVLVLVLVSSFTIAKLFHRTPPSAMPSPTSIVPKKAADQPVPTIAAPLPPAVAIQPPKASLVIGDGLMLDIVTTGVVWMRVKADNLLLFEGTLTLNERASWRAQREFILRLGSAGAVDLYLNKVRLRKVGEVGEVRTVIINKEGIVKVR